jgi:large conductance mechanosensitive channel
MQKVIGFAAEFKEFLKEYKIVGLAIAFIMGLAATTLMKSLVDNIIMPLITPFIAGGAWKDATLTLGSVVIKWGQFLADAIYFLILALVVFLVAKYMLKEEKVTKK